jgi:hypothetical protein
MAGSNGAENGTGVSSFRAPLAQRFHANLEILMSSG